MSEISLEDIIALLDKKYVLAYADYRDNLNESMEVIAKAIQTQDWSPIDESIFEWEMEARDYGVDYALDELKKEIMREFDLEVEDAEDLLELHRNEIVEEIYNRDESSLLDDLLRNTKSPTFFYDLGVEISDGVFFTEKEMKTALKEVKKALKIKLSNTTYDNDLEMMISQGDSGYLVIFFNAEVRDMMNLSDKTHVEFTNPMVALINTWNGSGDHIDLPNHKFKIPFTAENLRMDERGCVHYSYTHEVCGMYSNWCDCTEVKFTKERKPKTQPKVNETYQEEMNREARYIEIYKSGKCSMGDMDMRRHRNTYYDNNFPCGTHCKDCGNFWID